MADIDLNDLFKIEEVGKLFDKYRESNIDLGFKKILLNLSICADEIDLLCKYNEIFKDHK